MTISCEDADVFVAKNRNDNDKNNKQRELILVTLINNEIPDSFYEHSPKWSELKAAVFRYLTRLCLFNNIEELESVKCVQKAGRSNHYDFLIIINGTIEIPVEFKFNTTCVDGAPQFISLTKPSQYCSEDFESFFYDNCLPKIAEYGNLEMPSKDTYLKTIHSNKVECLAPFKEKYNTDTAFNAFCKKIDKEGIAEFIRISEINRETLSNKLLTSQKGKQYMCYKDGVFYHDTLNEQLYSITELVKKTKACFIYKTESGMTLDIRLRFKNGCGLQFPSLQIKKLIPTVKKLKEICLTNNISPPKLKSDICEILNKNKIKY